MLAAAEIIDTHAHVYLPEFDEDRDVMMQRATAAGVHKIFLPNIDSTSIDRMLEMESRYPTLCHAMIGWHPCSVTDDFKEALRVVEDWLARRAFAAIGEIGTDLYWDVTFREAQEVCFRAQLAIAREAGLPVVIHSRESLDLNIRIVSEEQDGRLRGIFHCFTGSELQARQIMELGFHLGIGGVITFKNAGLSEVISRLPLSALVLETDAPYLAPHPYRGKRNEPAYLTGIVEKIASSLGVSFGEVSLATSKNVREVFRTIFGREEDT